MKPGFDEERERYTLLRRRAEDALRGKQIDLDDLPVEDIQTLLHELQVHQAELAIQNDELRKIQQELEISRDLYSDLYNFAPAGYCTLSRKGLILEANQTLAVMLGIDREKLIRQPLTQFVDRDDQDALYLHRQSAVDDQQRRISKIRLVKPGGEKIVVRMESIQAHNDGDMSRVMLSDITEQERSEKEAQEAAVLWELQHRMADVREQERHQIARDLHDGPIQGLTVVTYSLHQLLQDHRDPELAPHVQEIMADVQEQIAMLRAYATEIRPSALLSFGLEKTICSHRETFHDKHPEIMIQVEINQTGPLLTETTALALFRIYQESLNNILKHVHQPEVQVLVGLEKDESQVRLEIHDNGQGFELPKQWTDLIYEGHLGLMGMRERAEAVGGQLEIYSRPGEGTRVIVTVPLADGTPGPSAE